MGIYFDKIFHPIWPYLSLYDYQQFMILPYMHFIQVYTFIADLKGEDKICNSHRNYDISKLFITLFISLLVIGWGNPIFLYIIVHWASG